METQAIMSAIERNVQDYKYSFWTVGITNDPERRKTEHDSDENVKRWEHWQAVSETEARDIEKHFLDKGMKGDTGGGANPTYVYIF